LKPSSFRALTILVPLIVVAFSPVLVAGYLRLDDHTNILDNPDIQRLSLSGLAAIWTKSDPGLYIPITYSIWWLYAGIAQTLKYLEINPGYLSAEVALGVAWIQKGKFQNAIDHYLSVLGKNPSIAGKRAPFISSIHNNLGERPAVR
jgi:hypothetical protein